MIARKVKWLSILLAFFTSCNSFAQVNIGLPGIDTVMTTFFTRYQHEENNDSTIQFQKRKDGWYVANIDIQKGNLLGKPLLFWDKQSGEYKILPYPTRDPSDSIAAFASKMDFIQHININELEIYNYTRNLYYGYEGWDWDVISSLKDSTILTDTLLESLARASSNRAINFFYNQYGIKELENDPDLKPLQPWDPISSSRVNKFMSYENLSIASYEKLIKQNPNYLIRSASCSTKGANERMFAYTTLSFLGFPEQGAHYLKGIVYPDTLLQVAKNYFKEIKPGGIFFIIGDNLTYASIFLQSAGIRTDIILINASLLALPRVVSYLDKKYDHKLFDIESSVYMKHNFDFALYFEGKNLTMRLDTFLLDLYKSPKEILYGTTSDPTKAHLDTMAKYFTSEVYLNVNPNLGKKLYGNAKLLSQLKVPIRKGYLFLDDIVQLSIINRNFLRNRIYFSFEPENAKQTKGLKEHKYTWELTPEIN